MTIVKKLNGKQIKKLRQRRDYSRAEFVRALKFTGKNPWHTCARWEADERVPSEQTVALMMLLPINPDRGCDE